MDHLLRSGYARYAGVSKRKELGGEKRLHLLEEAGAVSGIHGDELDGHAVTFADTANDGAAAHLSNGKVQQDLNEAAERKALFGANKNSAKAKALDVRDPALRACLPSHKHGFGGLDAGIAPLIMSVHQGDTCGWEF